MGGGLRVIGSATLLGGLIVTNGIQTDTLTSIGLVSVGADLSVANSSVINKNLSVGLDTTLSGALGVSKLATLGNGLCVTGSIQTDTMITSGDVSIGGNLNIAGAYNPTTISTNDLIVNDIRNSTASTNGAAVIVGGLGVGLDTNLGGALTVTKLATFSNGSNVIGGIEIDTLSSSGNVSVGGDLSLMGVFKPTTISTGSLVVTDNTNSLSPTSGAAVIAGGLGIGLDTYLGGTLHVVGVTNLEDGVFISGTAQSDSLTITTSLNNTGSTTITELNATNGSFSGMLDVTGISTLAALTATNVDLSGGLTVSANTSLNDLAAATGSFSNTLDVGGSTTLTCLSATNSSFSGTLDVVGVSTLKALTTTSISVTDNTTSTSPITGSLIVTGGAGLGGDVYIGNALVVTGISTLTDVSATNGSFSGTLGVVGATTLMGLNAVNGNFSGTLGGTATLQATNSGFIEINTNYNVNDLAQILFDGSSGFNTSNYGTGYSKKSLKSSLTSWIYGTKIFSLWDNDRPSKSEFFLWDLSPIQRSLYRCDR